MRHGRTEDEWARMIAVGREFLIERARMERTTSYTEFNTVLADRAATAQFDFASADERAALGEVLGEISERSFEETGGLLLSALVVYLGANDAGSGFYKLAASKGLGPFRTADDRHVFWVGQLNGLFQRYRRVRRR